ncbi:MAG: hypothetical protein NTX07_01200, partial [Solirubrobacterales bacterium]|nr:hypothetical protein [Solirubrobacterales bacterium]
PAAFTDDPALFALGVTQVELSSTSFRVITERCVGTSLLPNEWCAMKLVFTPEIWERGDINANLQVTDNSGIHLLPLSGTAVAPPKFILNLLAVTSSAGSVAFDWNTSDSAQFTISITQPVVTTVKVKKGKKTTTKKVTTIKPVVIKTIANQPAGSSGACVEALAGRCPPISWDRTVNGKPAAKGKWTITILAKSSRGSVTTKRPITLR